MKRIRWSFGPIVVALLLALATVPAMAGELFQVTAANGAVIALQGTPHLFIADEQGVLHWGGDTRGLQGRYINWSVRREVTLDQLRAYRRGDPWLSAGLLKIGDPIHLVKWETNEAQPRLLHIQSIQDVELFGINASNYGNFVLDQATWERRFNMSVSSLQRAPLPPAVPPPATPTPAASATPAARLTARLVNVERLSDTSYRTNIEVQILPGGAQPGSRIQVKLEGDEWNCPRDCNDTTRVSWGPLDAGPTRSDTGILLYKDEHGPYKSYTYTFTDTAGNTATVTVGDDRSR